MRARPSRRDRPARRAAVSPAACACTAGTGLGRRRSSESVRPCVRVARGSRRPRRLAGASGSDGFVAGRVARHGERGDPGGVDDRDRADGGCRAHVHRGIPCDRAKVDGRDDHVTTLVEARERQQILDEEAHALGLALDAVHRLRDVVVALDGAHAVQLGVAADRHERGAQLVARIADEAAHLPHRRVALARSRRPRGPSSC